jgi:hypothetical protein
VNTRGQAGRHCARDDVNPARRAQSQCVSQCDRADTPSREEIGGDDDE